MNKKLISMALTGVLAVGVLSVATPSAKLVLFSKIASRMLRFTP